MDHGERGESLRIVVGGLIGLLPAGGVAWDYVQYPLGFHLLGHDVLYLEDTGLWPVYNPVAHDDCSTNVAHLSAVMTRFGLADRWAYRDEVTGRWFGRTEAEVARFCRSADLFVNVSCSTVLRDAYRAIPVRALVDSDPMFTQIQHESQIAFTPGAASMRDLFSAHTHHLTFGESIGELDCLIPSCGVRWQPTRQPICLEAWPVTAVPATAPFTTVMNWSSSAPIEFAGRFWGQKDRELSRIIELPGRVPDVDLCLIVGRTGGGGFPREELESFGWQVRDANDAVPDVESYAHTLRASAGELSVAKGAYVTGRTGWFSCRSACYLACGRAVITQDTGWSGHLPSGKGLFAFSTLDEAVSALKDVLADPPAHGRAARDIAEAHFDSRLVLSDLIERVGG